MIKKIISGGQTGADQAALDAAIAWQISHGGWIPKGRLTEAGRLPNKYKLDEMPTDSYPARTEQNVIDSDGTLIISHGPLTGGSNFTKNQAVKHKRPYLHIDLNETDVFKAALAIHDWITGYSIKTLNVAGSKASKDKYIYQATMHLLTTVFHMQLIEDSMPDPYKAIPFMPKTVEEAVDILVLRMPLRVKAHIARMEEHELTSTHPSLEGYFRNTFGLWSGNDALLQDCRMRLGEDDIHEDDASTLIIRELWQRLRKTHSLKVVK